MNSPALSVVDNKRGAASKGAVGDSLFAQLKSQELVVGFSGPLGSGVAEVREVISGQLAELGYTIVPIKISALIRSYSQYLKSPPDKQKIALLNAADRYKEFQDIGNALRAENGNDFLAQLAASHISLDRKQRHPEAKDPREIIPGKVAYMVDQLKHPEECETLRVVYRDNFYLVGVLGSSESRKRRLKAEGISPSEAESLMERDRKQEEKHGQKLEKTLHLADFFVRNSKSNTEELKKATERFVKLVHGSVKVFPTRIEQGMYAAYSASRASACLSRQVGAAIHDRNGTLIATGCNDVPRAGGGLYREAEGEDDRCAFLQGGVCFNHLEKDIIKEEVRSIIRTELAEIVRAVDGLDCLENKEAMIASRLATKIRGESRLNDLIEFSRAVHAEMDALVSLARSGSGATQDGVLFTTTYPCHNCARHIVAAGIRSVYFVEPYEKSLATKLHFDSIDHESYAEDSLESWEKMKSEKRRVKFLHFEGVAPTRYLELFSAKGDRKDPKTGKAASYIAREAKKKDSQLLESYIDIEARLTKVLVEKGIEPQNVG